MSNVFNIDRFFKYLRYDLRNAKNNYWLSLLIAGLLPVIFYLMYQVFHLSVSGSFGPGNLGTKICAYLVAFFVICISFPNKAYGSLTDRRAGSSWLMLPASAFEKWLSMVIVTCIVLPLCSGILLFGSDWLMSVLIRDYGDPLFKDAFSLGDLVRDETEGMVSINIPAMIYAEWCEAVLLFTLGAIFFKKAKPAKTILAWIMICSLAGSLFSAITGTMSIDNLWLEEHLSGDPEMIERFTRRLNLMVNGSVAVLLTALLGGLYARIRTMKH